MIEGARWPPEEIVMDAHEQTSDAEILLALRMEYAHALKQDDYGHINKVIVPRFLERFGKYYDAFAKDWRSISLSRPSVRVIIDPRQGEQILMEWADRVLDGQIDLDL